MCSFRNAYLVQSAGSGSVGGEDVIKCQISQNHLLKLINLAELFTWSTLKGGFDWSGILWHPRHLHSLNLHFGLDMHFWRNTLLKFIQVATPVGHNMVYNLKPAFTEKISAYPEPASWGCIFGFLDPISHIWHHWYTRCNPETCAIGFSGWQVIFGPSFMVTEQYLVLVWADLHLFWTILTALFGLNIFCSDM